VVVYCHVPGKQSTIKTGCLRRLLCKCFTSSLLAGLAHLYICVLLLYKFDTIVMPIVRASLASEGISERVASVILSRWECTRDRYHTYHRWWEEFCLKYGHDTFRPAVHEVLDFLMSLLEAGLGYSSVNCARSALSMIMQLPGSISCGQHPRETEFMQGIFNHKPSLSRYYCHLGH
jgi:hypothetical protein